MVDTMVGYVVATSWDFIECTMIEYTVVEYTMVVIDCTTYGCTMVAAEKTVVVVAAVATFLLVGVLILS